MPRKKNEQLPTLAIPQTVAQADEFLRRLGHEKREAESLRLELKEQVEKLKAAVILKADAHDKRAEELRKGLQIFAEANRPMLTEDGKSKTVKVPAGEFGWRKSPPSVEIDDEVTVLGLVKERQLLQFIRVKEELNKKAMLEEPDLASSLEGVTIQKDLERFFAEAAKFTAELPQTQTSEVRQPVTAHTRKRA